jgi:hypothetical protein
VVARQDDDVFRPLLFERVDILIDGVSGSLIPLLVDPLLRGDDVDELAQFSAEEMTPAVSRDPLPPARTTAKTSFIGCILRGAKPQGT